MNVFLGGREGVLNHIFEIALKFVKWYFLYVSTLNYSVFFCKTKGHVLDIKNTIDDGLYVVLNYRSFVFYIHFLWKKVEQVIHFMMNDVQIHVSWNWKYLVMWLG